MALDIPFNQTLTHPITTNPAVILSNIKPLLLLIVGIVIYSIFIFKFYQYLSKKNILMKHWNKKYSWENNLVEKFLKVILYFLEYIILIPIIIFFWFMVFATILIFLSDNNPEQIMLISMAIIAAVRIATYYNELLSVDLAKMIPFTLLGVFILDMQFFSFDKFVSNMNYMFTLIDKLVFYLLCVVAIELIMRIQQLIRDSIKKKRGKITTEELDIKAENKINKEDKTKEDKKEERKEDKKNSKDRERRLDI